MDIICARHGNTFAPGEPPVWIGANEDLPLTAEGEAQAERLAAVLANQHSRPTIIFAGRLRRTFRYAQIVQKKLGGDARGRLVPLRDAGFVEIDYGDWARKTNAEIEALGHGGALERWNTENRWPEQAHWGGSEEAVRGRIAQFLQRVRDMAHEKFEPGDKVLLVNSNGVLRYLAMVALGEGARGDPRFPFKMRTGNYGVLRADGDKFAIVSWDIRPGAEP